MLNSEMNYPYPVLRSEAVDYKKAVFHTSIEKTDRKDGFDLEVTYEVTNDKINEMLNQKILAYALQIQCDSTWYRSLEISESDRQHIFIPSYAVHGRVKMCPCIVAMEDIKDFSNEDFSEEYEGISFSLNKGETAAIGEMWKFDAVYEDDMIKKGESIVHFVNDDRCGVMFCEWEYDTIQIHLPKKQYEQYTEIGRYESWKVPLLNAVYVVPVIVQGIIEISNDEDGGGDEGNLSQYAWYKTLRMLIEKEAGGDRRHYRQMLKEPIRTAQLLLNDNSRQSLELLGKMIKQ